MSEPTLNSIKAETKAADEARAEEQRLARKTQLLSDLAGMESRLEGFVDSIKERRAALKAEKQTAEEFLETIRSRADQEDLDIEELETLLRTIEDFRGSRACASAAPAAPMPPGYAAPPVAPAPVSYITEERARRIAEEAVRDMVRTSALGRR